MFCPQCGNEAGSQPFCGLCGTKLASNTALSQPKHKQSRFARNVLLVLGIVLALFVLEHLNTGNDTPQDTARPPIASSQPQPSDNRPPTYEVGQQFSVGYWSYRCNNAYRTPFLGVGSYSMEHANAEFVVVDITAQNNDTSSSTLPPFQLMDEEGRTYDSSSAGMLSQGFFSVLESLNPGVSKRGNIAFDVPPNRQYVMVVSGGIESGGKRAIVVLPTSEPRGYQQSPPVTPYAPPPSIPASIPAAPLPVHDEKPLPTPAPASDVVKGSVLVSVSPYPSIRIPPELKGQVSRAGAKVALGQLVSRVEPVYPQNALQQQIEGTVKLHVIVGRDGTIHAIEAVSGPPLLVPAATAAVRQWHYKPTSLNGWPVEAGEEITMVFRLKHPN
jgi:TonB family protein